MIQTIRYAQSSPFYFPVDGRQPVKTPDAIRWADYIRDLARSVTAADYPARADYEKAQVIFKEAEGIYRILAEKGTVAFSAYTSVV